MVLVLMEIVSFVLANMHWTSILSYSAMVYMACLESDTDDAKYDGDQGV